MSNVIIISLWKLGALKSGVSLIRLSLSFSLSSSLLLINGATRTQMKICCDGETKGKATKEFFYERNFFKRVGKSKKNGTSHLLNLFRFVVCTNHEKISLWAVELWEKKRESVSPFPRSFSWVSSHTNTKKNFE